MADRTPHAVARLSLVLLFAAGAGPTAQPVQPTNRVAFETGNGLLALCDGQGEQRLMCEGYVVGIADALNNSRFSVPRVDSTPGSPKLALICTTKAIMATQLTDVVANYLRSHPEIRHYSAAALTATALSDAFPCYP